MAVADDVYLHCSHHVGDEDGNDVVQPPSSQRRSSSEEEIAGTIVSITSWVSAGIRSMSPPLLEIMQPSLPCVTMKVEQSIRWRSFFSTSVSTGE